jgi:hypothetical protein
VYVWKIFLKRKKACSEEIWSEKEIGWGSEMLRGCSEGKRENKIWGSFWRKDFSIFSVKVEFKERKRDSR